MNTFAKIAALVIALASALPLRTAAADDLLARMSSVNPDLHSYTATLHAHVALTTFPFLSTDIVGTYYHKDPDLDKLQITSGLPLIAQSFSKLFAHMEPPSRWNDLYTVTKSADDGTTTNLTLVPRTPGNVKKIEVLVDNATATIGSMRWDYQNGGWVAMTQHYGVVKGDTMVTSQTGHVEEPGYIGDVTTTLSGYHLNPDLPDSLFSQGT
jgi:outer membrane lipoprotein-sorting protein